MSTRPPVIPATTSISEPASTGAFTGATTLKAEAAPRTSLPADTADWETIRNALCTTPGCMNIGELALDRNVAQGRGAQIAIRHLSKRGSVTNHSYIQLLEQAQRFSLAMKNQGIEPGDAIFTLLGRVPELYISALGALRQGLVFTPLFSAFGPEPVRTRMEIGSAKVLVTTTALYRRKIAAWRKALPSLKLVVVIDGEACDAPTDTLHWSALHANTNAYKNVAVAPTAPDDLALVHFTSGTTGKPKGVMHVHEAVINHVSSAINVLGLTADDTYWCTADPGWVTGTSYGIVAPLVIGSTLIIDEAEFDARRWCTTLAEQSVTVWYTAPTAIRMLMRAGTELVQEHQYPSLRVMASVGEPLNPQAVDWGTTAFGKPFLDNWWQTETGAIMIANTSAFPVRSGSMGKAVPGIRAAVVEHTDSGVRELSDPKATGELALATPWPSMMRGYLGEMARYQKCFIDGWYLTGDLVQRDSDGYFWFVGRADDVIQSAGHLISPFEVESALLSHVAVAEAGVIGLPDEVCGERVCAQVALNRGYTPDDNLLRDITAHARARLGPAVAPKAIEFTASLPKTRSGKIMRRLLRARALGLDEGDTSTLETASNSPTGTESDQ